MSEPTDHDSDCGMPSAALWFGGVVIVLAAIGFTVYFLLAVL